MKKIIGIVLIAFCTSIITFAFAKKYIYNDVPLFGKQDKNENLFKETNYEIPAPIADGTNGGLTNLEYAADKCSKAVVHIKTETKARAVQYRNPFGDDIFEQFFGRRQFQMPNQEASGSGVIISTDGYIVTNNHVIDGADNISVTFNDKKTVKAKLVGKDPSTDLALLKVEETNLPTISYGNSDNVRLGQWVLAVGYPLNLETTVTAGIVSAKYRSIGINQQKAGNTAIESFIQTDAAVNPGNSGGALVNANGELIGINSAIASPTGSYAGYSYAIPSNLVKKVIGDLMKFGNVQRAYLGIGYLDTKNASAEESKALGLDKIDGVYVSQVNANSSAADGNIQKGDIITKIGDKTVRTGPQLLESIAQYRPGDKVDISYIRNGTLKTTTVTMKNISGNTDLVKTDVSADIGLTLKNLSKEELSKIGIANGVQVINIDQGSPVAQTRMKKGYIIMEINGKTIYKDSDVKNILSDDADEIQLSGMYPGYQGVYYYTIQK